MIEYAPKTSIKNLPLLLQKVTVLILDPDPRIANIVKHVMLSLGFGNVMIENTIEGAKEKVRTESIDFIIADFDIELQEGEESFVEFVRTSPESPAPYIPIIMLTGHTERQEVEQARDLGITEFAAKPFTAKSLTDRVVRVIENPRSFIITKRYTGPDRRRKDLDPPTAGERRAGAGSNTKPQDDGATETPPEKQTGSIFERFMGKGKKP